MKNFDNYSIAEIYDICSQIIANYRQYFTLITPYRNCIDIVIKDSILSKLSRSKYLFLNSVIDPFNYKSAYIFQFAKTSNITNVCVNNLKINNKFLVDNIIEDADRCSVELIDQVLHNVKKVLNRAILIAQDEYYCNDLLIKKIKKYIKKFSFLSTDITEEDSIHIYLKLKDVGYYRDLKIFHYAPICVFYRKIIDYNKFLYPSTSENAVDLNFKDDVKFSYKTMSFEEIDEAITNFFENILEKEYTNIINTIKEHNKSELISNIENI